MSTAYESESTLSGLVTKNFTAMTNMGSRIFRNNVGLGWSGKKKVRAATPMKIILEPGDVVISNARPVKFGLCEGSSDKIGWTQIVVTEEMVGKKIAVFTAIEEKSRKGAATAVQKNFISTVLSCGGIAVLAKSLDDLKSAIDSYKPL